VEDLDVDRRALHAQRRLGALERIQRLLPAAVGHGAVPAAQVNKREVPDFPDYVLGAQCAAGGRAVDLPEEGAVLIQP
jgi:hypothetical protein